MTDETVPQDAGDEADIRALIQAFADAVPGGARALRAGDQPGSGAAGVTAAVPEIAVSDVVVSDVVVTRELASAVIRRPPDNVPAPLYFRRERGMWTVCAPAEDEL